MKRLSKYSIVGMVLILLLVIFYLLMIIPGRQRHTGSSMVRLFQHIKRVNAMINEEDRTAIRVRMPSKVSNRMILPMSPQLYFGYGLDQKSPYRQNKPVHIEILIRGDGSPEIVFEKRFPPGSEALKRWNEIVIDLNKYSQQVVEIIFKASVKASTRPENREERKEVQHFLWSSPVVYTGNMEKSEPNVILIGIDSLRADYLGCYGYRRDTSPAIDGLASKGILFENAYSQSNWTLPSFSSIFTGLYPSHHGAIKNNTRLPESLPSLPEFFRNKGYFVAGFHDGGYVEPHFGFNSHFDIYRKINGFRSISIVIDWIHEHPGMPFFLFLHTYDVHAPYGSVPPEYTTLFTDASYADQYDLKRKKPHEWVDRYEKQNLFNEEDCAHMSDLYAGEIRFIDDQLSILFRSLRKSERDNTYIILLSDHGQEFGEHGKFEHRNGHLYRELVRVPLIMAGPDLPRGVRIPGLVETIDLFPTVRELLSPDSPMNGKSFDGTSFAGFLSSLDGQELKIGEPYAISQHREKNIYAVRSKTWTMICDKEESVRLFHRDRHSNKNMHADHDIHQKTVEESLKTVYSSRIGENTRPSPLDRALSDRVLQELQALGYLE